MNEQPDLKVYSGVDSGGAWESSASSNSDKLLIMLVDQTYENYNEKSEILLFFQKKKIKVLICKGSHVFLLQTYYLSIIGYLIPVE